MASAQAEPNHVLTCLLAELGWSPRTLARSINRVAGPATVADTAPYHWRDAGRTPRPPLPALTAWVLSRELGRPITVAELWAGRAADSPLMLPADVDLALPWSRAETLGIIDDWVVAGLLDRRYFLAVSGAALTATASDYLRAAGGSLTAALDGRGVSTPLLEQIGHSLPLLQRLDDANGGGAHLAYVGAQFRAVALLLREHRHPPAVERRLFAALTELGQLAGWMAFDAGQHGLAQRYWFTALRAANEAGYHAMAAHILADLAFQAATREHGDDAVHLGEAAQHLATQAPATVRASVSSRLAYGYATAGRLTDADRAHQTGLEALSDRWDDDEPAWMYFLTPNHLDTQAGYALAHAGTLAHDTGDTATARRLLRRADQLLRTGAHNLPLDDTTAQRRALFEGAWLAVTVTERGDLERACTLGRQALERTKTVHSERSTDVLRNLAQRMRRRTRNEHVADFLPVLHDALVRGARG